jgi:menaquinone-dependent protoporphyrinogen oxidase
VDVAEILAATGAREHRVFAGKLARKRLSFPEKAIVSALRVPRATWSAHRRQPLVDGRP